jgi:arylsulfatase A-like enzyme
VDALAAGGIRFTDGYVSCPVCSPTRAGLMTGRYQQRFGHEHNPGPQAVAAADFGLPLSEKTVAERLKALGYATGMVGKWHLGFKPEFTPPKRGFDEFFGFLGGAHGYLPGARGDGLILRGDQPVEEKEYLTDAFARESVAFVERHKDHPFFLYMPFNAVHSPMHASEKRLERFKDIKDEKRRTYATMLAAMDDAVGAILAKVREHKLEEDTLVLFHSDNGGPTPQTTSRNDPLRGYKGMVFEGGIRIPFIIQWKGVLPAGKVSHDPLISLDLHPTAVAAAGGEIKPEDKLDGVNVLPWLAGKTEAKPHDRLFWRFGAQSAARVGDWKLIHRADETLLFNLAEDIGEKDDLAAKHPEKVKELQGAYDDWNAKNVPAKWARQAPGGGVGKRARRREAAKDAPPANDE